VSQASNFDNLVPHLANAERDYLIPVIGQPMYDELQEFYEATYPDDPTEVQEKTKELLNLCQSAVAHIAYWIGFDLLNTHISDGFKRTETDKIKGLFKYQEENLKSYFRTNGFNGLDSVLKYLEENIASFGEFKASDAYTVLKSAFIPNTDIFNSIVFINKSRLTFLRMKPHIQLLEDTEIVPLLGSVAFAELKDEMEKDSPDAKMMAILPYIRKPLAFLASALLMEESGADLQDNGLYFTTSNDTERKPSETDRIAVLVNRNRNLGNAYLDQLRSYLVAHAADWPDVATSTGKVLRRDNTNKKTFWA
jgi:hypothetical protein